MSYLAINGITIKQVEATGPVQTTDIVGGGLQRAADASLLDNWVGQHPHKKFGTPAMLQSEATFLRALLERRFDHWFFDGNVYGDAGLFSDKGLQPTISVNLDATGESGPYFGDCLVGATTGHLQFQNVWNYAQGLGVTVMVMRLEGSFVDYEIVLDTFGNIVTVYRNGVVWGSSISSWFSATFGTINIVNTSGSAVDYAELVVVQAPMPSSFAGQVATFRLGRPWASPPGNFSSSDGVCPVRAPQLYVVGDALPQPMVMMGDNVQGTDVVGTVSGVFASNHVELQFELERAI